MPTESQNPRRDRSGLLTAGLVAIPTLCCLVPWLIAAGAIGAVVSWLTNAWVILMISLVLLVVVVGTVRRRGRTPH
jgi:membrane protein implicated in regulation of membrane protease activity